MNNHSPKSLVRIISIVMFSLFISFAGYSQNNNCEAKLEVENNQVSKKASVIGTAYKLSLENLGSETTTFDLSIIGLPFDKNDNNVDFRSEILEKITPTSKQHNLIKLADSKYRVTLTHEDVFVFFVQLLTTSRAEVGSKYKAEIIVSSENCANFSVSKTFQIEVVNIDTKGHESSK